MAHGNFSIARALTQSGHSSINASQPPLSARASCLGLNGPAMADTTASRSLYHLLAKQLPKDVAFTFYHYSTPPTKSPALFSAPPHAKSERTYCESHFLAASITPKDTESSGGAEELLVLAIEVLVYSTKRLTTIFVSKADSTGYISLLSLPRSQAASPLKTICGTFVSWLAKERQRDGRKLVISLFARAQDQYLFPASIENKDKHVLDDRGLVKWWCKVLDPVVQEYKAEEPPKTLADRLADRNEDGVAARDSTIDEYTAKGYLVIPGFEPYDTLRYTPPPSPPVTARRWAAAHPLLQIAPYPSAPPRCLVPHFPDDPKSRFLDELDDELPDRGVDAMAKEGNTPSRSNGQWKSVKTLDQFWEFMAFRQECSSGRIVGFIWIVITPPAPSIPEEDASLSQQMPSSHKDSQLSVLTPIPDTPKRNSSSKKNRRRKKVNTEYGPIPLILPRIKSASSNLSTMSNSSSSGLSGLAKTSSLYYVWPESSRGTVVVSAKDYDRAHQVLLQQNFATRPAAARSTKRWKEEVAVLGGVDSWGRAVVGQKEVPNAATASTNGTGIVNVIGVRKKRKPETSGESESAEMKPANGATVLGAGLVRKKTKVQTTTPATEASAANGVNTLGEGLVRKKPKA